jgi:hypothetical protein
VEVAAGAGCPPGRPAGTLPAAGGAEPPDDAGGGTGAEGLAPVGVGAAGDDKDGAWRVRCLASGAGFAAPALWGTTCVAPPGACGNDGADGAGRMCGCASGAGLAVPALRGATCVAPPGACRDEYGTGGAVAGDAGAGDAARGPARGSSVGAGRTVCAGPDDGAGRDVGAATEDAAGAAGPIRGVPGVAREPDPAGPGGVTPRRSAFPDCGTRTWLDAPGGGPLSVRAPRPPRAAGATGGALAMTGADAARDRGTLTAFVATGRRPARTVAGTAETAPGTAMFE